MCSLLKTGKILCNTMDTGACQIYSVRCVGLISTKCFAMMQGKVKFCVGFVLKYAYVNYENTQEKDLVCASLLLFSLM